MSVCEWLSLCVSPLRVQLGFQQFCLTEGNSYRVGWDQVSGNHEGEVSSVFLINADSYLALPTSTGCMRVRG